MAHSRHEGLSAEPWWSTPVGSLVQGQKVVTVDSEAVLEAAALELARANVSSAPIFDRKTNEYIGSLDWSDVAAYVMIVLNKGVPASVAENDSMELQELVQKAQSLQPVPVRLAADLSSRNPLYNVTPETTVSDVLSIFGQGIHRVCVMGPQGLVGVLSQSALARHLYTRHARSPELAKVLRTTLRELGMGQQGRVVHVDEEVAVVDAIKTMVDNNVSSVPIASRTGQIVGNVSQSDIRYVMLNRKIPLLYAPVLQFAHFLDQQLGMMNGQDRMPVFDIPLSSTLALAVAKLDAVKAHRVWVVDQGRLSGVVSFTDALRAMASAVPTEDSDAA